jgi:imidazolonepropionase-like amidohydrolase
MSRIAIAPALGLLAGSIVAAPRWRAHAHLIDGRGGAAAPLVAVRVDEGRIAERGARVPPLRTRAMVRPLRGAVRMAYAQGIPIAAGTDDIYGEGDSARVRPPLEIDGLTAVRLMPLEAITAATRHAARLLGLEPRTGSVTPGPDADLPLVERHLPDDTPTLHEPLPAFRRGRVAVNGL